MQQKKVIQGSQFSMLEVKQGDFSDLIVIEQQIPEFSSPKDIHTLRQRLAAKEYLLLVTYDSGRPVGYKLGYALNKETFYSWLGAVIPSHRKLGLAQKMLIQQEAWVIEQGYQVIEVKTKNRFSNMIMMLVKNHYHITDLQTFTHSSDNKIKFSKVLNPEPSDT